MPRADKVCKVSEFLTIRQLAECSDWLPPVWAKRVEDLQRRFVCRWIVRPAVVAPLVPKGARHEAAP